ncbi:hypothetical protein D3C75_1075800 [compost metagenome]
MIFDNIEYLIRYLNKNNCLSRLDEVKQFIEKKKLDLLDDYRLHIHGHDFIELLTFYINSLNTHLKYNSLTLWKALYLSLEQEDIKSYTLFKILEEKIAR